uniref:Uncharacterized protein n=1 Tax=Glossina pallidipes TaxID=7398 RepID=A0A1A9ZIR3_GLOPL
MALFLHDDEYLKQQHPKIKKNNYRISIGVKGKTNLKRFPFDQPMIVSIGILCLFLSSVCLIYLKSYAAYNLAETQKCFLFRCGYLSGRTQVVSPQSFREYKYYTILSVLHYVDYTVYTMRSCVVESRV